MPFMESFNLAQLTKEMVVAQIRSLGDPARLASETVRGTLIARLKGHRLSNYEIQEAVSEVCRGAIQGMIITESPMGRGAARALMAAEAAGREAGLDAALVANAAVKGISDARRFVSREVLVLMSRHLEGVRRGAGQSFTSFCTDLNAHQSHPDYIAPV
ncbi:MAG: hypothetical protein WC728_12155 [Elusimicrobiota bacterium]